MSESTARLSFSSTAASVVSFRQRAAVIVGSGAQIGRACALAFAADGFFVVAIESQAIDNETTCKEINSAGGQVLRITADIADYGDMQEAAEHCRRGAPPAHRLG